MATKKSVNFNGYNEKSYQYNYDNLNSINLRSGRTI